MDELENELKLSFIEEAVQLMVDFEQSLLTLETSPKDRPTLEKLFRVAHNFKGSSKAVGFDSLGEFTHQLESFLLKVKDGQIDAKASTISVLLACSDHLTKWINALKQDFEAVLAYDHLIAAMNGQTDAPAEVSEESMVPNGDLFKEDESEPTETVHALELPQTENPKPVAKPKTAAANDESIRVSIQRLERLINYVGELVILQTVLKEQTNLQASSFFKKTVHQMGKVTKEVQDISMSLRMVPLKQTFQKMQRIVRDTSSSLEKKINLVIKGEDTEVDKTVLESLSDPLVHLIRNAVDHGVESPDLRLAAGKSETGTVSLSAFHQSGHLVIEVKDDGGGLDPQKLRNKAIEKGIIKSTAILSDKEAFNLIFAAGFTTKALVTDVSGRGVGMDVVRTNIEALQGDIQIETNLNEGTCFRIRLPLTLAIIDGMIISCQKERYILPLSHVHESLRPSQEDLHFVSGLGDVLSLRGEKIPLFRLDQIIGSGTTFPEIFKSTVIVVRTEEKAFCVVVDDIIGQHQVVVKQLGQELNGIKGISGSAILGDGRPALILELSELIKKAKPAKINNSQSEKRRAA